MAGEGSRRVTAGYEVAGRRKKVTVDRVEAKKLADGVGQLTAVAFAPSDRAIVAGGPAGRRRYMDILLALSEPGYLAALSGMRQALRQRNAALRTGHGDAARVFDSPYAVAAGAVARARRRWAAAAAARFQDLCSTLGEPGPCSLQYAPDHHRDDDSADRIAAALERSLPRDLRRGMTTVGPHRDDLQLSLNGRDQRTYGSAGQQRTAAIALRLLEAEALAAAKGASPIALYDDVFAELDRGRQERLLALIRETMPGQAVVVAPRESEVPRELLDVPRWTMHGGTLAPR